MTDEQETMTELEPQTGEPQTGPAADADEAGAVPAEAAPGEAEQRERTPLNDEELDRAIEALLIIADEPLSAVTLATATGQPVRAVRAAVGRLRADYDGEGEAAAGGIRRAFELREVGGGWRVYARAEHDELLSDFVLNQSPTKLSQAALETLAVIAYKQPITRGGVAAIRAVNVDSVVRTLLGRGLITEAFTDPDTGAIHYATTELLLTQLGVNSIEELPKISPLLSDGLDGFDHGL